MSSDAREYFSYMLRLWQAGESGRSPWRASLQSAITGERMAFADLDALFAFLREQVEDFTGDSEHHSPI